MARTTTVCLLVAAFSILPGCSIFGIDEDDERPSVLVVAEPSEGLAPLAVEFSALPREDLGDEVSWQWFFGDGAQVYAQNPDHVYEEPGEYEWLLRITLADGTSHDYGFLTIVVTEPESSEVGFEEWVSAVNAACTDSTTEADTVTADPSSPEALAQFVTITEAETASIEAAGIPEERAIEAESWLELRNSGADLFVSMAQDPPKSADDQRIAELDSLAQQLAPMSLDLGLSACAGEE